MKRLAALALAALLSACSDSTTGPTNHQPTDLATVLRELTLPSLTGMSSALTGVAVPLPTSIPSAGCTYSTSAQGFLCPTVVAGGLTVTQSYTLLDAAGRSQSAFDGNTTASIRAKSSVSGTVTADGNSLTVDQVQDMTVSGLLTSAHVMNGTSVMKMKGTIAAGGSTSPISTSMNMTVSNLVMPVAAAGAKAYPLSGVITSDMTVAVDAITSVSVRTEMTFNGTSKVAVVTTTSGFSQRCTVDLAHPGTACA